MYIQYANVSRKLKKIRVLLQYAYLNGKTNVYT